MTAAIRIQMSGTAKSALRGISVGESGSLAVFGVIGLVEVDANAVAHVGGRTLVDAGYHKRTQEPR
jgi:hypothetical protein